MPNELRRRSVPPPQHNAQNQTSSDDAFLNYDEYHLSASALLSSSPTHSSHALKMHTPAMYNFLPATIQWFLSSRCCPKSWSPQWKERYLIALGEYLYRFKDENGKSPKGAPIPVATVEARLVSHNDNGEYNVIYDLLPPGYEAVFEISSIGKVQYFAVQNREEAVTWINSIRQLRQEAITRTMGHANNIPYPSEWKSFDVSAKRLKDQKMRIKNKLEMMNKKEQEMQTLNNGGPAPTAGMGYFG